jgi:hypothetical protein
MSGGRLGKVTASATPMRILRAKRRLTFHTATKGVKIVKMAVIDRAVPSTFHSIYIRIVRS